MTPLVPAVDTHAHVFDQTCKLVEGRRYSPSYEATTRDYLAKLDRAGIDHGVLVQPSFLGTDNGYMLEALRDHPKRLRGIAVLDPDVSDRTLDMLSDTGVVGLRYNLFSRDPAFVEAPEIRRLTARVAERGWLVEIHTPGPTLPRVLDAVLSTGACTVVHHFGRPESAVPQDDPGFRELMTHDPDGPVWVKLSAAYRLSGFCAAPFARAFLGRLGPKRLVWGSDWPWTEHENRVTYEGCLASLSDWLNGSTALCTEIDRTSRALYGFVENAP